MPKVIAKDNHGLAVKKDGILEGFVEEHCDTPNGKLYIFTSGPFKQKLNARAYQALMDSAGGSKKSEPKTEPKVEEPKAETKK